MKKYRNPNIPKPTPGDSKSEATRYKTQPVKNMFPAIPGKPEKVKVPAKPTPKPKPKPRFRPLITKGGR